MIDLTAAKSSAMSLLRLGGSMITNALPMIPKMATVSTQLGGTYDKIYPLIHINYPTRDEVDQLVRQSFLNHDTQNLHNGQGATPGKDVILPVPLIPKEVVIKDIKVRAGSPINAIGYSL